MALIRRLFEDDDDFFGSRLAPNMPSMQADFVEKADNFQFIANLPGFTEQDISIELNGPNLFIKAEHKKETEDKTSRWFWKERVDSSVSRGFRLPGNVDTENITASLQNGVLKLIMPKLSSHKNTRKITINN